MPSRPKTPRRASSLSSRAPWITCVLIISTLMLLALGCAENSTASSQPGDALLHNPMDYKSGDNDFPDISGGGIGHFDKKGFNKDLNSVLNP